MARFSESPAPGLEIVYDGEPLHEERSPFQLIQVYEHPVFGRMLVLDGLVQTTERDEFMYHEMLVHVPLIAHREPRRVLIIGGGDGGTLRRVLEHPSVERVLMCEIDERVTAVSREFLPDICAGAFDDPRAEVVFEDGNKLVHESSEDLDAIIIDSSDPVGPGVVLFSPEFYGACVARLGDEGILAAQIGTPTLTPDEMAMATTNARKGGFADVRVYLGSVTTYPGTLWAYMLAGQSLTVDSIGAGRHADDRGLITRYWTSDLHSGAFALPGFVRAVIDGRPGPLNTPPSQWGSA